MNKFGMILMKTSLRIFPLLMLVAALFGCGRSTSPAYSARSHPPVAPTIEGSIRVVCWNIEWFPGGSMARVDADRREMHKNDVAEALRELRPDILFAQEIANQTAWDDLLAATALADGPRLESAVMSRFSGRQQQAIASSLPVEAGWHESWVRTGENDPPRGFSHAVVRLPSGRLMLTYCVHLKSNAGGEPAENRAKRTESVQQLLSHIDSELPKHRAATPPAILIAGDFNTDPDAPSGQFAEENTIGMLLDAGFQCSFQGLDRQEQITWPSNGRYPDATFDYVFYKNLNVVQVQVPEGFDHCSDHRPVVVDLTDH